jgi:hypothetical protein
MGISSNSWAGMLIQIAIRIQGALFGMMELLDSEKLPEMIKTNINSILKDRFGIKQFAACKPDELDRMIEVSGIKQSLMDYTFWLHLHYGEEAIILIDEYDACLIEAKGKGYYNEAIAFFRDLFTNAMKSNPYLKFAVITGICRVSKESMFSEFNNVVVEDVFSPALAPFYGLSETEVLNALKDAHLEGQLDKVKGWYNGYNFGGVKISNPLSMSRYLESGNLGYYWVNTGGTSLVSMQLKLADYKALETLKELWQGGAITADVSTFITFHDLNRYNEVSLYSLLVAAGYLTVECSSSKTPGDERMHGVLKAPNNEVRVAFKLMLQDFYKAMRYDNDFVEMLKAITAGDAVAFEKHLSSFMLESISYFDSTEAFYHGLTLGIMLFFRGDYEVKSNREAGEGRFDIALVPLSPVLKGIIIECKKVETEEEVDLNEDSGIEGNAEKKKTKIQDPVKVAMIALKQVKDRKYVNEFKSKGIPFMVYGMAFLKKSCHIEILDNA